MGGRLTSHTPSAVVVGIENVGREGKGLFVEVVRSVCLQNATPLAIESCSLPLQDDEPAEQNVENT